LEIDQAVVGYTDQFPTEFWLCRRWYRPPGRFLADGIKFDNSAAIAAEVSVFQPFMEPGFW